jgi:hypothetical protein
MTAQNSLVNKPSEPKERLMELANKLAEKNVEKEKNVEEEKNVVCKMFVKGKPNNLIEVIKNILLPLNVKNTAGYHSDKDTPEFKLTLLVEKC